MWTFSFLVLLAVPESHLQGSPGSTDDGMCDCSCEYMEKIEKFDNASANPFQKFVNKSEGEKYEMLKDELAKVQKILEVQKKEIPQIKARKISADDKRPSSQNIGILGIALLTLVFGFLVFLDLLSLPEFARTIRSRACP